MNGRAENLISFPECLALAAAVPEAEARVLLIQSVLGHVDPSVANLLSWRFRCEDLPYLGRPAHD